MELASRRVNVILVDILEEELLQTTEEIQLKFPVQYQHIQADLTNILERQKVMDSCAQYPIGLFCCNHAMTKLFADGKLRAWIDTPIEDLQRCSK